MHLCYVLLSPTFGMHQYTADFANRMVRSGHQVTLITTDRLPRDRYAPEVEIHTPVSTTGTGLSPQGLDIRQIKVLAEATISQKPQVVHFTGPHIWNLWLVSRIQKAGIPVVHTIHDLKPHHGRRFGFLLHPWNRAIYRKSDRILVHGQLYRRYLINEGLAEDRVFYTPLLFLFLSHKEQIRFINQDQEEMGVSYEPFVLFFGRIEAYKGLEYLLTAFTGLNSGCLPESKLLVAGTGDLSKIWPGQLPPNVELRNRLIADAEALDLFQRCSLVVLPYIDATQSGLIASAYFFQKPVLVSRSGALPEYVRDGETGFIVEPGNSDELRQTLSAALDDLEHLHQMGCAGRQWYERQRILEEEQLQALYASF